MIIISVYSISMNVYHDEKSEKGWNFSFGIESLENKDSDDPKHACVLRSRDKDGMASRARLPR
jgi:hypothetical protein